MISHPPLGLGSPSQPVTGHDETRPVLHTSCEPPARAGPVPRLQQVIAGNREGLGTREGEWSIGLRPRMTCVGNQIKVEISLGHGQVTALAARLRVRQPKRLPGRQPVPRPPERAGRGVLEGHEPLQPVDQVADIGLPEFG